MNIEIANRLVEFRKKNNLSQEALAEKLGITRQAVSKWERAEASPDTDNLIALARLYKVSLDELLGTGEAFSGGRGESSEGRDKSFETGDELSSSGKGPSGGGEEASRIGGTFPGSGEGVSEAKKEASGFGEESLGAPSAVKSEPPVLIIEEEPHKIDFGILQGIPVYLVVIVAYVIMGAIWNMWHPGWLLFFLPPIWQSAIVSIEKKNPKYFAYPVFVSLLYCCLGLFGNLWHPGWIVFLTIPLYYPLVKYLRKFYQKQKEELRNLL